jgi:predicted  nucleic acid-binding Zn-ribbon protein
MAPKRGNGNGSSEDPVVKALHEVVAEVHVVATELKGTNSRLDRVEGALSTRLDRVEKVLVETRQEQRAGFAALRGEMETGFTELRTGLDEVRGGIDEVRSGLDGLRGEVHEGFAELGQKIDSAADRDRHLEQSVQQLGERVAKLEARSPEPR